MTRSLTREETKLITRKRLLEAAAKILREEGFGVLTTSRVAREAGVAQPTFYVHFKDMEELLHALAADNMARVRQPLRDARKLLGSTGSDDLLRETFRLPLRALIEQPELFRLSVQESHRPGSPIGNTAREMQAELQKDLVEDLIALGAPAETREQREQIEMIAEGMMVLTQTMALGHLDGRYTDLEKIVDVLVRFALGAINPLAVSV